MSSYRSPWLSVTDERVPEEGGVEDSVRVLLKRGNSSVMEGLVHLTEGGQQQIDGKAE